MSAWTKGLDLMPSCIFFQLKFCEVPYLNNFLCWYENKYFRALNITDY